MPETGFGLICAIMQQPVWLQAWIGWMVFINFAVPLLFIAHTEARVTIVAFLASAMIMSGMFEVYGYAKILGLAHLIVWPPLLLWLTTRWYGIESAAMRIWIMALFATNGISLLIDAVDVAIYFMR